MNIYGIIGAGGFGREVMPIVEELLCNLHQSAVYFVVENQNVNTIVNGINVINVEEFLSLDAQRKFFNVAISDSCVRERVATRFIEEGCEPFSIKAKNSIALTNNEIMYGAILCPFVTITSNTRIGKFFHANIYSYVAHDCIIGDYVTFAPKVCCNGNVVVEDHVYIGTGAIIKQGDVGRPIVIGKGSVVGMGAVVTKSIDPYEVVIGTPAKPFKRK